jgi:hypothetical protein
MNEQDQKNAEILSH